MNGLIILNGIGSLFILFIIWRALSIRQARKQCESLHKRPFQIKVSKGTWKDRLTVVFIVLSFGLWLIGLLYYETIDLGLLHFAAILGMTSFFPLFREGKVGHKGIAIAEHFIAWEDIDKASFTWTKPADFHYPNGTLSINTKDERQYDIIVDKQEAEKIEDMLHAIHAKKNNRFA